VRRVELGVDKSIKKPPLAFQAELRQCRENPRVPELEKELDSRRDEIDMLARLNTSLEAEKTSLSEQLSALSSMVEQHEGNVRLDRKLQNGELDGIELRRRYGDDPGNWRHGGLFTAGDNNLLHGDHEMPTMRRTASCLRAERKHAKNKNNMNKIERSHPDLPARRMGAMGSMPKCSKATMSVAWCCEVEARTQSQTADSLASAACVMEMVAAQQVSSLITSSDRRCELVWCRVSERR
jgi:hypothetical protein